MVKCLSSCKEMMCSGVILFRDNDLLIWNYFEIFKCISSSPRSIGTSLERGPDGSGKHAEAVLSVVFGIGLKYRRRLGVLATILPKSTERTRTYLIYALNLLFLCSSASFYDPIDPEEGSLVPRPLSSPLVYETKRRASPNKELSSTSAILMWHHR